MATKITNATLLAACRQMLTERITYDSMDCQAAVEEALMRCGVPDKECDLGGSNAHYRSCWWRGTPEQCCELLGIKEVPAGIGTFNVSPVSATTPAQYRNDDYGDATHMGIYMLGGQTFNSSEKNGGVTIALNFKGRKAVNGGTNMVGFLPWIDCGLTDAQLAALLGDANATADEPAENVSGGAQAAPEPNTAAESAQTYAAVVTPDGNPVKAREQPRKDAVWKFSIPNGTRVQLLGESGNYYRVHWMGKGRWVQKDFLQTL